MRDLLEGSILLASAVLVSSILEYIFQISVAYFLGRDQFGLFEVTYSIYGIASALLSVGLGLAVTKLISQNEKKTAKVFSTSFWLSLLTGIFCGILLFLASLVLANTSYSDMSQPILAIALLVLLYPTVTLLRSVLLGAQLFRRYSISTVSETFFKLISALLLVYLFKNLLSYFFSIFVGYALASLIIYFWVRKRISFNPKMVDWELARKIMLFSLPVALVNVGFISFVRLDGVMVKLFSDPSSANYLAAIYNAPSVIARMLFYLSAAVSTSLFPILAKSFGKDEFERRKKEALMIILPVVIFASLSAFLVSDKVLLLFYPTLFNSTSSELAVSSNVLFILMLSMSLLSISNLLGTSMFIKGQFRLPLYALLVGIASLIALCYYLSSMGISGFAYASLASSAVIFLILIFNSFHFKVVR